MLNYTKFQDLITKGAFIKCGWDGSNQTEEAIKKETNATIRCIIKDNPDNLQCIYSNKPAQYQVIFAKAY